jgi:hypothetical protein
MRHVLITAGLILLGAASGCNTGPKKVLVKGKLTNNGKSVLPDRRGGVTIVFSPDPATGNTFPTVLNTANDTFEVPGPDMRGIPVGKYKVTLSMMVPTTTADGKDLPPATVQSWQHLSDQFNSKYSGTSTPIVIDVTGADVDIDLAKLPPK